MGGRALPDHPSGSEGHGVTHGGQRRIVGLILVLAAAAALLWYFALRLPGYRPVPYLNWLVLAALSAVAERFVVHIQLRREAQAVSLSEVPQVVGLFLATPLAFGIGRVLGMLAACVLWRRSNLTKTIFNTVQVGVESAVAVLVFHGVLDLCGAGTPGRWVPAFATTAAVGAVSALNITAVIALADGTLPAGDLFWEPVRGALTSAVVAIPGLIAVVLLEQSRWNALLALPALAGLLLAYRAYARLAERHLSLERLYRFSQVVGDRPEVEQVLQTVLAQATEVLRAERAEILFLPADQDGEAIRIGTGRHGQLKRAAGTVTGSGPWAQVVRTEEPLLITRHSRTTNEQGHLADLDAADTIIVPLRGDAGLVGALMVANRLGAVRTFDGGDVKLLETIANHAGVALGKGQLVSRLQYEAAHDALTGLPNRTALRQWLDEILADPGAGRVAVLLMDLDDFRKINDTLGHHHGDALLQHVARLLRAAVPEKMLVSRLGGDEFAVVIPELSSVEEAVTVGEQLMAALCTPTTVGGIRLEVGASLGIGVAPDHASDVVTLLRHADMAMYQAKNSHRGIAVFDPTAASPENPAQLALVGELRTAIGHGELRLFVQPKADAVSGDVVGVEALVRWQHPRHGLVMPDEFIPIAERNGLIKALTGEVLRAAIIAATAWERAGSPVAIAVNLSPRSLLGTNLAAEVAALLADHGLPAELLTLELTESSMMTNPRGVATLMAELHRMGVHLSIDDFGTGYSSLSTLRKLPLDEIKIDKSFVMGLGDNPDDETIVRSVVDLGLNLGLKVVAEGVENESVWHSLRRMGCTQIQGYYLTRPIPVEDFPHWLATYRRTRLAVGPVPR
jgi:diguanylate cyclase (GGDEF)-like protein